VQSHKMELSEFESALASRSLTRRQVHQALAAVGVATITIPAVVKPAPAETTIEVFSWQVYSPSELYGAYIEAYGNAPSFQMYADEEEALVKVRAGYTPTLVQTASFMLGLYRDAGWLAPIDTSKLTNYGDIFPQLKMISGMSLDGAVYAVPAAWGYNSVLYRKDLAPEYIDNNSWEILWDPKFSGRLAQWDHMDTAVLAAALILGIEDPFHMSDDDLERVRQKLVEQRPLLRFYWASETDMEQAMAAGEIVAAMSWNSSYASLRRNGIDVGYMVPKEGTLAWVDVSILLKDGPGSEDEALAYIDAFISAESGKYLIENYGFGAPNAKAYDLIDAELLAEFGIEDPLRLLSLGKFYEEFDPTVREKAVTMFDEVKAGF